MGEWASGYYANTDTTIGASDRKQIADGNFNLENDLGFDDHKTVPRARVYFLIGDSQGISFDDYSVNRSSGKTFGRDASDQGNNDSASASVRGKPDFDFGSAACRWWFGQGNHVFGPGLGGAYCR